jgi:hypothetical protein
LLDLRESLLRETKGAQALVNQLLTNPYITIATAAKVLRIAAPTATRLIRELETKGLLRETTGKKWGKNLRRPRSACRVGAASNNLSYSCDRTLVGMTRSELPSYDLPPAP